MCREYIAQPCCSENKLKTHSSVHLYIIFWSNARKMLLLFGWAKPSPDFTLWPMWNKYVKGLPLSYRASTFCWLVVPPTKEQ